MDASPTEPQVVGGSALAAAESSRPSRRQFLIGSGAAVLAGLVGSRLTSVGEALAHESGHHADPSLPIWAAARRGDSYLALAGSAEQPSVRELRVAGDGNVDLGGAVLTSFPEDFVPVALHATGSRLLIGGATLHEVDRIEIDYRPESVPEADRDALPESQGEGVQILPVYTMRPALYEAVGDSVEELPLSEDVSVAFGVVTAIASTGRRRLAVIVEGSNDIEQAYNDVTRVADSADGGQTWDVTTVADELGEGEKTHLAAQGSQLFLAAVDGRGRRRFYERSAAGASWAAVPADRDEGSVLAVSPRGSGAVEVIDRSSNGEFRRATRDLGGSGWKSAKADLGEDVLDVLGVSGAAGELIALGESRARLVN